MLRLRKTLLRAFETLTESHKLRIPKINVFVTPRQAMEEYKTRRTINRILSRHYNVLSKLED